MVIFVKINSADNSANMISLLILITCKLNKHIINMLRKQTSSNVLNKNPSLLQLNHIILILFLLSFLFTNSAASINQPQQQQQQLLSSLYWQTDKSHLSYKNLFSHFKEINITTRLIIKSHQQQKTLATQSSTIILEADYLKMYKNKLGYKIKFNLTDELIQAIKRNQTFVETAFYFISNNNNYLIEKQLIPFLGEFTHNWREGIQHLVLADLELFQHQQPQQMILKQMDVYFFQIHQDLPFEPEFQGSQAFGLVQVSLHSNKAIDYYYPRPLAAKINTQLKENYIPLNSFEQSTQTKYQIKINLKIGSHLFPLIMHTFQAFHDTTEKMTLEIDGMEIGLGEDIQAAAPFIIRYFKKVLFQGSLIGWTFLFIQTFITLCSKMTSFIAILFEIQIFKNIIQYRGMSLYSILVFISIDLILIVVSYGYLRTGDFLGPLVSLVIGMWKVKKMARVQMFWEFPFVEIAPEPWYEIYGDKDKRSLRQSLLPCSVFLAIVITYPFLFQDYFTSQLSTSQPLIKYILHRFVLSINQYRFILAMLPQILLNLKVKSCNAIPWKLLIVLVWFYSVDNLLVPVSTSIWEVVFYLKEGILFCDSLEMLLTVLIGQKLFYGNNLDNLPIIERNLENINENRPQNEKQNKNQDDQKNNFETSNEKIEQESNLPESVSTKQADQKIEEKPKQE